MTNPNSAAQAVEPQTVLSFDERERILCQFMGEPINHDRELAIAIETAVLSKLRAPVAGEATDDDIRRIATLPECHHGGDFAHAVDPIPFARALLARYAAPQASEAVRNAALEEAAQALDRLHAENRQYHTEFRQAANVIRALKQPQAAKDGSANG